MDTIPLESALIAPVGFNQWQLIETEKRQPEALSTRSTL